jgi:Fe-S-cluster-containing hydrogenase component 2
MEKQLRTKFLQAETSILGEAFNQSSQAPGVGNVTKSIQLAEVLKAKKEAPKETEDFKALRGFRLFDGLTSEILSSALESGEMKLSRLTRDQFVIPPDGQKGGHVFFVLKGQVAVGTLPTAMTSAEIDKIKKKERKPIQRIVERNLALFEQGDIFSDEAGNVAGGQTTGFYTLVPSEVIQIDRNLLAELLRKYPDFKSRVRRAIGAGAQRLQELAGVKEEIFDFFIRHGFSLALNIKIRQLDRCIDCKACEEACETRYGESRLQLGGYRLGMLDFPYNCHTCSDPRCVTACNSNACVWDEGAGEIKVIEENCVGCSGCAKSCPYGSIHMIEATDKSLVSQEKLRKSAKQGGGPVEDGKNGKDAKAADGKEGEAKEAPKKKAKIKKQATKCDHCVNYDYQMACVSACPTGALVQIKPEEVFRNRSPQLAAAAVAGFDRTVAIEPGKLFDQAAFESGGLAKTTKLRGELRRQFLMVLGVLITAALGVEVMLRLLAPTFSGAFIYFTKFAGKDAEWAREHLGLVAGHGLGKWLGIVGTVMMGLAATFYPFRKHVSFLRKMGTSMAFFDWHLFFGIVGPILILFHSSIDLWRKISGGGIGHGTFAFVAMIFVVASGFVGRFFYTKIPRGAHGNELKEKELEREWKGLRERLPDEVKVDETFEAYREVVRKDTEGKNFFGILAWFAKDDFLGLGRTRTMQKAAEREIKDARVRARVDRLIKDLMDFERRRVLYPTAQRSLVIWKKFHVPFTICLTIFATVHIVLNWLYGV